MKRVLITGSPGSGKSTLAGQLGAELGLPVYHLDKEFWLPGWVVNEPRCFKASVEKFAREDCWIIDGNYTSTLGIRLEGRIRW